MFQLHIFVLLFAAIVGISHFPALAEAQIFDGQTNQEVSLAHVTQNITPGTIVIVGEQHGMAVMRDQQVQILKQLREQGLKVSVGLEFLNYTDQPSIDQYRQGQIAEDHFLAQVAWKGFGFEFYKSQLIFPEVAQGEFSLGLNLTRTVTSKISKNGLVSLTEDDLKLMPPHFELGRESYKARFIQAAGAHCPSPDNCFAAQSAWDDTMAWQATQFIEQHPEQVLVIIVGEFHVQYGGGLPYRILQRRPNTPIKTISQVWVEGLTEDEIQNELRPSELEGARASAVWISK